MSRPAAQPFAVALLAAFFLVAHAAFIRSDIFLRNAALFADDAFFFTVFVFVFVGVTFGVAATGAAAAATFAALIAAHRALVAATIALRPTALSLRFAAGFGACASSASRMGARTVEPWRASIAFVNLSFSGEQIFMWLSLRPRSTSSRKAASAPLSVRIGGCATNMARNCANS